jgi:DNA-binding FrmR family transcriptional regulator
MQLEATELKAARDRLMRAQGQIMGIVKMIDEGRDCTDLLTQLSAASTALTRAGFSIIATGMAHCGNDAEGNANREALEKAFVKLA